MVISDAVVGLRRSMIEPQREAKALINPTDLSAMPFACGSYPVVSMVDTLSMCKKFFEEGSGEFTSSITVKSSNFWSVRYRKSSKAQRRKVVDHHVKLMTNLSGSACLQQPDINQERKTWEPQCNNQKIDISIIGFCQWSGDVDVQRVRGLVNVSHSPMDSPGTFCGKTTLAQMTLGQVSGLNMLLELLHLVVVKWRNASIGCIKMSKRKCNFW